MDNLTVQGAEDFFSQLGSQPEPKKEEEKQQRKQSVDENDFVAENMGLSHEPSQVILE